MPTKHKGYRTFNRIDGMGIIPVRWWFESTRYPSQFSTRNVYIVFFNSHLQHFPPSSGEYGGFKIDVDCDDIRVLIIWLSI